MENGSIAEMAQVLGDANPNDKLTFVDILFKGGPILIPIALLFVLTIYLIVERWLAIDRLSKTNPVQVSSVHEAIKRGRLNDALNTCNASESMLLKIMGAGIKKLGNPLSEIEGAMAAFAQVVIGRTMTRINYLGIISGVAPMLGFIGTILGIIKIFYNISLTDNISIGTIAGGLYEKMVSSCAGLVVGVIAYAGLHILNSRVDRYVLKVEEESLEFINLLQEPSHEA
jgi:biopolymer transport protein ExbB